MQKRKIRFLSGEDVARTLPMAEAMGAMKDAFLQLSSGRAAVPLRTPMALRDRDDGALLKSVGNAVQDLAAASRALDRAERLGLGIEISL